jgi:hypothetical protein
VSRRIRAKIREVKDDLGVKRIPEYEPVPVQWLLEYYYGRLSPGERVELKEQIKDHVERNDSKGSSDFQAFLEVHSSEVEEEARRLEEFYREKEYHPEDSIKEKLDR